MTTHVHVARTRHVAAVVALGMALLGCSHDDTSRRATEATSPSVDATPVASTEAATPTAAPPEATPAPEPGTSGGAASTDPSSPPGPGDFGTLRDVCGPGDAAGATDQGVSDTEIVIGTPSDAGNTAVPGLNQELWDSADAFVGWCNDAGGIDGRKIRLVKRDAKLFEAGARMVEACQSDFMLVGGGMAVDEASIEPRLACGLPSINGFAVGEHASVAPLQISPIGTSNKWSDVGILLGFLAERDPSLLPWFGDWSSQVESIRPPAIRARAAAKALGYTEVHFEELPAMIDNWRATIEKVKASGVRVLTMFNTPENMAAAMRTMSDVGYFPDYVLLGGNHYNDKLIGEAGEALDRTTVYVYSLVVPFELADQNPATRQYIELLDRYAGGAAPKSLGVNGFSAWLLFARAASECGSQLTRECVMEHAAAIDDWTGGGLHAPTTPSDANGEAPECFVLLRATSGGFVHDTELVTPNDGVFFCDPANAQHVAGL